MSWQRHSVTTKSQVGPAKGSLHHIRDSIQYWRSDIRGIITDPPIVPDAIAGLTVAAVALPLNLALAVASGLPASTGVISGALGGFLAALFGGSRWQVSGPAAALNIMVFAIVAKYGVAGAATAAIVTGIMSLGLSFFGLGAWISRVPEAVIAGFTTGVGLKLLDQQLPHLLGVDIDLSQILFTLHAPEWLNQVSWYEVLCGLFVVFIILTLKAFPRVPAALVGLAIATFVSNYLNWDVKRVGTLLASFPPFQIPEISAHDLGPLVILCIPLALLGAVESLLSASVIDRLVANKSKPHHANLELFGQGIANLAVGFFSGMPVTGVVVRSTVNIQSGGKTRLAAMFHGAILLLALLHFTEVLEVIPISALAGLLCLIGFRLVELSHLFHLIKTHRLEAVAFTIAAVGTLNNRLFLGLVTAVGLALLGQWIQERLKKTERFSASGESTGVRAVISEPHETLNKSHFERKVPYATLPMSPSPSGPWTIHVSETPSLHPSAYVHPKATVIGRVIIDRGVHIAAETSIRADEGTPFYVGPNSNLQDGVVLHALKERHMEVAGKRWAIYIDAEVSVAHQALIHGPCYVGAHSFVGFKAVVHDSVVGPRCFIGIGAVVVGVEIPEGRFVPHGSIIDTQEKASALGPATEVHRHFSEDVVEVNLGLRSAYHWQDLKMKEKPWKYSSSDFLEDSPYYSSI